MSMSISSQAGPSGFPKCHLVGVVHLRHVYTTVCPGFASTTGSISWCIVQVIAPRQFGKSSVAQRLGDLVEGDQVPVAWSSGGHAPLAVLAICLSQQTPLVHYHQLPNSMFVGCLQSKNHKSRVSLLQLARYGCCHWQKRYFDGLSATQPGTLPFPVPACHLHTTMHSQPCRHGVLFMSRQTILLIGVCARRIQRGSCIGCMRGCMRTIVPGFHRQPL